MTLWKFGSALVEQWLKRRGGRRRPRMGLVRAQQRRQARAPPAAKVETTEQTANAAPPLTLTTARIAMMGLGGLLARWLLQLALGDGPASALTLVLGGGVYWYCSREKREIERQIAEIKREQRETMSSLSQTRSISSTSASSGRRAVAGAAAAPGNPFAAAGMPSSSSLGGDLRRPPLIEKKKRADEADASARPRLQKAARPVYTGKRKQRTGGKPNVTTGGGGEVPAEALRLLEHGFDE